LKLDISHLVVNGCSYTYGHGIWDPVSNAWPSLVAKKLGVPLVNLAVPGQSNYAIERRTKAYFLKNLHYDNNPFYIHAYTQSQRREVYIAKDHLDHNYQDYRLLDTSDHGKISRLEKEIVFHTDSYCLNLLELTKLNMWHGINCLLDAYNVNHLSTDYMPNVTGSVDEWINKHHYTLKAEIYSHPGKLTNFNVITKDISKTPCLHETEEGHAFLADYIYDQITKRYSEINVIDEPYAKLKDTYVEPPSIIEERKRNHNLKLHQYLHREWGANIYYLTELGYDWTQINWMGRPEPGTKP
jgi:hypothetical protein